MQRSRYVIIKQGLKSISVRSHTCLGIRPRLNWEINPVGGGKRGKNNNNNEKQLVTGPNALGNSDQCTG